MITRYRTLAALILLALGGAAVDAANLALLPGVVAVAESQHRDRWGVDGCHPSLALDGKADTAWLSDNWEYAHTLALVFPQAVTARQVVVEWSDAAKPPLTLVVRVWRDGTWVDLKTVQPPAGEPKVTVDFDPVTTFAIAVSQPAGQAHPEFDRRFGIRELQVSGESAAVGVSGTATALAATISTNLAATRQAEADQRVAPQLALVMRKPKASGFLGLIDRDDLARGRRNIATRPWAKRTCETVVKDADWWVAQTDDFLYNLIPAGNPRAICPSFEKGCPLHGGARSSFTATLEKPYVWRCGKGGEEWFDGAVVKNPKTGEDVTVRDDGSGFLAPEGFPNPGRRTYFVAAYRYYLLGKVIQSPYEGDGGSQYQGAAPVLQLSLAYAMTGDPKYAHKAAVLVNRLAEVYRFYDGCVEGPSQRQDGYIGQTFERFLAQNLILCCDLIWDEVGRDTDLQRFFAAKGNADYNGDGKVDGSDFTTNLQRNLLGYLYEYVHRLMPYFDGDFIMYEMTALAALAATLNNADLADEMLNADTGLRVMLTNEWFRDGKFIYDSTGYNLGNAQTPLQIAEWMQGFHVADGNSSGGRGILPRPGGTKPSGLEAPPTRGNEHDRDFTKPLDLYNDPSTNMGMLFDFIRNVDCDGRVPQIGDVGGSRSATLNTTPPYSTYDERGLLRLPQEREYYRQRLLAASSGDLEGFRDGRADYWLVFHAEAPETAKAASVQAPVPTSHVFDDGGLAILRAGQRASTRMHVPLTFSKGSYAHGHTDKLAINLFRYGYDLSADLGYPTTWTDLKYGGWETTTASHCTVLVDEQAQRSYTLGNLRYFATEAPCDVVEASAEGAYPQCSLYRRTLALVRDDDGEPLYLADLFRVAGGQTRDYLFHSLGKPETMSVTVDGTEPAWVKQAQGSLAGEDVAPTTKGGYGFLGDVLRTRGEGLIRAVWKPATGVSQGDRYLLTKQSFTNCTVEFNLTRTGQAGGPRERTVFVFSTDPGNVNSRRVIMLPADTLPVGQPVPVKIVIRGAEAQMTISGTPTGSVSVAGNPPVGGSLGLLHYYNYAYDYTDFTLTPEGDAPLRADFNQPLSDSFWGKNDGTYQAEGGVLKARDTEPLQLTLTMLGAPGREVIRASAEGYGLRGVAPLEGHLIVRDRPADATSQSTYLTVLEATTQGSRVRKLEAVEVTGEAGSPLAPGEVSAFIVETQSPDGGLRRDLLLSSRSEADQQVRHLKFDGKEVSFAGRFALLTERKGKFTPRMLVGGGELTCDGKRLGLPGTFHGTIVAVKAEGRAVAVKLREGSPVPDSRLIGHKLIASNPAYGYVSPYTIEKVEALGKDQYRFTLNLPLVIARGVVGPVDKAKGAFASQTPVMKLRVNAGLLDGKLLRTAPTGKEWRLKTATEGAFEPVDPKALLDFPTGGSYVVCDLGVGDAVEVVPSGAAKY